MARNSKKRSNGEGTIYYEESRKRWVAEIAWQDRFGETHKKRFTAQKQVAAKTKLNEFKRQLLIRQGDVEKASVTFEEFSKLWIENTKKNRVKPTALMRKECTLRNQVYPHLGSLLIDDIPGDHASQTLNLYRSLHGGQNVCMTLYGVETSQASYLSIQRHDLRLPLSLAEDDRIDLLKTCVQTANQLCKALRKALESVEAIPKLTVSSAVLKQEAECEKSFWQLCTQADCQSPDLKRLYANYVSDLCRKLGGVYDETLSSLHLRAHTLAAAEEGRRSLNNEIQKLKKGA